MTTAATKLEVCNLALDVIREAPVQSLTVESAPLRTILRNYELVVEATLQSFPWGFAKEKFVLSRDGTDPAFDWSYRYEIPPDALRILPIRKLGMRGGEIVAYEIVGRYIETNEAAPLRITAIVRKDNPGEWTPLFLDIVRAQLGLIVAGKFTGKQKFVDTARELLQRATARAEYIETIDDTADPIEQHDILRVRE